MMSGTIIYRHLLHPLAELSMDLREKVESVKREHGIVGRDSEIEKAIAALKVRRHLMIEGPVGVGKTVLATAVASHLGIDVLRIDGDERYTEQKLSGWFDPALVLKIGYCSEAFVPGPLTEAMQSGKVLFLNEMNRMPEGVQNILLPAMDEGMIEIPRFGTVHAAPGFVVISTQNPREFVATTALSEALSDRFELLMLDYQPEDEEIAIVKGRYPDAPPEIIHRTVWITRKSRDHENIRRGASIRAAMSMVDLSMTISDDPTIGLRSAAHMALPTRIEVREESPISIHDIIDDIVDECLSLPVTGMDAVRFKNDGTKSLDETRISDRRDRDVNVSDLVPFLDNLSSLNGGGTDDLGWAIAKNYSRMRYLIPSAALADLAKRIAVRATIRRVLQLLGPVSLPTIMIRDGYSMDEESEIDLEATFDNAPHPSDMMPSDIVVEKRMPREMAVGLILDASLSMTGDKLAIATAAIAVIAHRLKTVDYLLITFNDRPRTVKRIDQSKGLDDLICELLSFNAAGYTNIELALHKGVDELSKASTKNRVGILITDGNYTVGDDPRSAAMAYRRLFVIMIKSHDCQPSVCEGVARNGGGRMYAVSSFDEIPRVLYRVLRMVSQGSHATDV